MPLLNSRIRAVGFCQSAFTITGQKVPGLLLVPGRKEIEFIETPPIATPMEIRMRTAERFLC